MIRVRSVPAAMRILGEGLSRGGRGREDCGPADAPGRDPRPKRRRDLRLIEAPPEMAVRFGHPTIVGGEAFQATRSH